MTDQLTVAGEQQANELVFLSSRGEAVTDSITISEMFNKNHDDVLKDVRKQIEYAGNEFSLGNFSESTYKNSRGRDYKKYIMTEEAFMLVAMGYNTKEAVQMKVKFIQEFKRMKEFIQRQQQKQPPMSPLQMIHTMTAEMMKQDERLSLLESKVEEQITIDHGEQRRIQRAIGTRVYEETSDSERRSQLFRELHREIRDRFGVASYRDLKRKDLLLAIRYIEGWIPRREVTA